MDNNLNKSDIKRLIKLIKAEIIERKHHISLEGLFDLEHKVKILNQSK